MSVEKGPGFSPDDNSVDHAFEELKKEDEKRDLVAEFKKMRAEAGTDKAKVSEGEADAVAVKHNKRKLAG